MTAKNGEVSSSTPEVRITVTLDLFPGRRAYPTFSYTEESPPCFKHPPSKAVLQSLAYFRGIEGVTIFSL